MLMIHGKATEFAAENVSTSLGLEKISPIDDWHYFYKQHPISYLSARV